MSPNDMSKNIVGLLLLNDHTQHDNARFIFDSSSIHLH